MPELPFPQLPPAQNVIGVGIDLESISRIQQAIERNGNAFLEKVFTPEEIELCNSRGAHRWESFSARWAAKEAFSKALGTGIGETIGFTDIAILSRPNGEPYAQVSAHGKAALEKLSATRILVSLTHTKENAAAIILLTQ